MPHGIMGCDPVTEAAAAVSAGAPVTSGMLRPTSLSLIHIWQMLPAAVYGTEPAPGEEWVLPCVSIEHAPVSETRGILNAHTRPVSYTHLAVSVLSNLGKLVPLFFYRDRKVSERLALSIGMFTRGEVGAGVILSLIHISSRSDRMAKYDRLLRIEEELGDEEIYGYTKVYRK